VLAEYAKAPAITRERIYIETMQQVLSATSKVIVDTKGSGNLLYLPLDKLMQQGGAASMSEAQQSQRPSPEPVLPADSGPRSRDTLRPRERGER
jgi:membrane protease subunit HflK